MQFTLSSAFVALATLATTAFAAPVAEPQTAIIFPPVGPFPDPGTVFIKNVNYAGSGCPAKSVAVSMADNHKNVVLAFDSYIASVGPGIPVTESRKNCNINFNIQYPPGFSYTLFSTDYRGFVSLDDKVTAVQKSVYFFSSLSGQFEAQSTWVGKREEDYMFTDKLNALAVVWSPCQSATSTFNINTQIRVENTKNKLGSGMITTDSITQKVTHILGVAWKKC